MSDEQNYESHLLTIEEAMARVWGHEQNVLRYVWIVYQGTLKHLAQQQNAQDVQDTAGEQSNGFTDHRPD